VWVTVFSPNDISRLRRPKAVNFGTKVAYSTRMTSALRLFEKVFNCGKKSAKISPNAKDEHILLHTLPQKPKIIEMRKLAQRSP